MSKTNLNLAHEWSCSVCLNCSKGGKVLNCDSQYMPFKLVMRYLEIDIVNSCKTLLGGEQLGMGMTICEKCDSILNQFKDLYQDSELIRLFISGSIQCLYDIISQSQICGKSFETGIGMETEAYNSVIDMMRKDISTKCFKKLTSKPKIKLRRITGIPGKLQLSETSWNIEQITVKSEPVIDTSQSQYQANSDLLPIKVESSSILVNNEANEEILPTDGISVREGDELSKTCLICLSHSEDNQVQAHSMSFKVIMRYLGVDIFAIFKTSISTPELVLCDKCDKVVSEFSEWYKDLEILRLLMNNCVYNLFNGINQSKNCVKRRTQFELKSETDNMLNIRNYFQASGLRDEIVTKSLKKLISTPKVLLEKLILVDNHIPNLDGMETEIKEETEFQNTPLDEDMDKITVTMEPFIIKEIVDTEETTSIKNPFLERSHLCSYCKSSFLHHNELHKHQVTYHTMTMLEKDLPPGTTESLLEASIQSIIDECRNVPGLWKCVYCKKKNVRSQSQVRTHILSAHLQNVIQILTKFPPSANCNGSILKRFQCIKCPDQFYSWHHLVQHRRKHGLQNKVNKRTPHLAKKSVFGLHKTKLQCPFCSFQSRCNNLLGHQVAHHMMLMFEKEFPPGTSETMVEATIQRIIDKSPPETVKCDICDEKFYFKSQLRKHILLSHLSTLIEKLKEFNLEPGRLLMFRNYLCFRCNESFVSWNLLVQHRRKHVLKNVKRHFRCDFCSKMCFSEFYKQRHIADKHPYQFFQPKLAPTTTEDEFSAGVQVLLDKRVRYGELPKCGCPYCSRLFRVPCDLQLHLLKIHFDKLLTAIVNPEDCTLRRVDDFKRDYSYKKNEKTGRWVPPNLPLKCEKCDHCGEIFSKKGNLRKHMKIHTGQRKFKCPHCNQVSRSQKLIQNHLANIHTLQYLAEKLPPRTTRGDLEQVIFSLFKASGTSMGCVICHQSYRREVRLRCHIVKNHGDVLVKKLESCYQHEGPTASDPRRMNSELGLVEKYLCKFCPKHFTVKFIYKRHLELVHTYLHFKSKLSPETTEVEFLQVFKRLISQGKLIRDGYNPKIKCPRCTRQFTRKESLKRHLLEVHFSRICLDIKKNQMKPSSSQHVNNEGLKCFRMDSSPSDAWFSNAYNDKEPEFTPIQNQVEGKGIQENDAVFISTSTFASLDMDGNKDRICSICGKSIGRKQHLQCLQRNN